MKIDYPLAIDLDFGTQDLFELNKRISGKLTISPKIDLDVEQISYRFIVQARGALNPIEQLLSETILSNETVLENGKNHSFDLSVFNNQYPSYQGKNVDFLFKVEAYVILQKKNKKEGFFAKIFKSDKDRIFKEEKFLSFKSKPNLFKARPLETTLSQRSFMTVLYYLFSLIMFVGIVLFFFWDQEKIKELFYLHLEKIQIATAILATVLITYFLLAKILIGKIEAKFNDRNSELLEVNFTSNWGFVRSISVNYFLEEKVTDNRGTSSSTYTHVFYKSPSKLINKPLKQINADFLYPEEIMPSVELGDAKIHWVFVVKVKTYLGIPFYYDGDFIVEK